MKRKFKGKVRKVGGSPNVPALGITIPNAVVKDLGLKKYDIVKVEILKEEKRR